MIAQLLTPKQVQFSHDEDVTLVVKYLDENNQWEIKHTSSPSDTHIYNMLVDGVYNFYLYTADAVAEWSYGHLNYEYIKYKLRTYAKDILCTCCENGCDPCENNTIYDFTLLSHLALAFVGNNEFILVESFDPEDPLIKIEIERLNNAIVRSTKYVINYDI